MSLLQVSHPTTPPQEGEKSKPTILVVEDSASVRRFLVTALGPKFDLLLATGAAEAMDLLNRTKVDLILTDIMMPHVDGFHFFDQLQERHPDLPVIFMTGYQEGPLFEQARERSRYLVTKPFHLDELERTLRLAHRERHQEAPIVLRPSRQRQIHLTVADDAMVPLLRPGDTLEIDAPDPMDIPIGALLYVRDGERLVVRRYDRHSWTHGRPRIVLTDATGGNELAVPWDAVVGIVRRHRRAGAESTVTLKRRSQPTL